MGSWFEGFVVRNTVAQSKFNFETRFRKYNFFNFQTLCTGGRHEIQKKRSVYLKLEWSVPSHHSSNLRKQITQMKKNKIWVIQALWSHKWSKRANHSKITRNRIRVKQDLKSLKLCNTSGHLHATQTTRTKAEDIK